MSNSTPLYGQILAFLRQYSCAQDLRHFKTLAWMVSALIGSGQLNLAAWEPYVLSRATKAQSLEWRWRRFLSNDRVSILRMYIPLVLAALRDWQSHHLYLALDTTPLWSRYCMIHLSIVCCGRAVPFLWCVLEHNSVSVAFEQYQPLLRKARWLLRQHPDVMLLADRGFANHGLMGWLQSSRWHYCLRLPCDVRLQGVSKYPTVIGKVYPPEGTARLYRQVRLWADGQYRCNLVLATVTDSKESWAVATDEPPTLQTLWQYALRFRVEIVYT